MSQLYYIMSPYAPCGNSASWWRIDGHGYCCDLNEAWQVTATKARFILDMHRGDRAYPVDQINKLAQLHFDVQRLGECCPLLIPEDALLLGAPLDGGAGCSDLWTGDATRDQGPKEQPEFEEDPR